MGRARKGDANLPKRVELHHGTYYYRPRLTGKRVRLSRTKTDAIAMFVCVAEDRDVREWKLLRSEMPRLTTNMTAGNTAGIPNKWLSAIYRSAKNNARARSIEFGIAFDDIRHIAERAAGRCEVSGIAFNFDMLPRPTRVRNRMIWAPSIDRIDAVKGYASNNIRLVCCAVNICLQDWGDDTLKIIAQSIVKSGELNSQLVEQQAKKKREIELQIPRSVVEIVDN